MHLGGLFRERPLHQRRSAVRAYRLLRTMAAKAGFDVVLSTFYSPVPQLDRLPPATFDRVSELPGVRWDPDAQLTFVEERLAGPARQFRPPRSSVGQPDRYAADNPSYSLLDATVHFAMVRALRPKRVVELGSGWSTLVTLEAGRLNASDGRKPALTVYDPFPSVIRDGLPGLDALHRTPAQEVPPAVFEELEDGDLLFIDTTHTVKIGSEVNYLVLEVLPRLRPGVVVHIHDVFLPYEYPRSWMEEYGLYWNEQYLLQAFLIQNECWDLLIAVHGLSRLRRAKLEAVLPVAAVDTNGGGFWMRRAA